MVRIARSMTWSALLLALLVAGGCSFEPVEIRSGETTGEPADDPAADDTDPLGVWDQAAPEPGVDEPDAPHPATTPEEDADAPSVAWQIARYPYRVAQDDVHIHFTRPGTAVGESEDPEADDEIADAILAATETVDLCLYEFDRELIVDAAVHAAESGVLVRFVGDSDESGEEGYVHLVDAGVEMALRRPRDRIMHNKFVIIDGRWVFTGSTNFSNNGMTRNNNNVVRLDSPPLADIYEAEFQQMFDERLFGTHKEALDPELPVAVGGRSFEAYFSPQDDVASRVRDVLAEADYSVLFMIFSFTHNDIADDLLALHQDGLQVVGVYDYSQARSRYSTDKRLAQAGLPVFIDGNENATGFAGGKLHHKVMVIDAGTDSEPTVITGSFNWSNSATRYNDENLLVMRGADIANAYLEEFCRVLDVATVHAELTTAPPDPCARLLRRVRINEIMANPAGSDGPNEWVEIVNAGVTTIDLAGWQLGDGARADRHVFAEGLLPPGGAVAVYSGALEGAERIVATSGALGLANNADEVVLRDPLGVVVDRVAYRRASSGVSFNRENDGGTEGAFVLHDVVSGDAALDSSPGTRADGTDWQTHSVAGAVLINEFLPNPAGSDSGKEFVELVSRAMVPVDLSGYRLGDAVDGERHVFAPGTIIQPGEAVVVFDRGVHDNVPGAVVSSSGSLSLNNTSDLVILTTPDGMTVDAVHYEGATSGVSWNRDPDGEIGAPIARHDQLDGAAGGSSPGLTAAGELWGGGAPEVLLVINELLPNPDGTDLGQEYVEIVNAGPAAVDLSGMRLGDRSSGERHVFADGTLLEAGQAIVVFDRGDHGDAPGAIASTSGTLSLNNSSETFTLYGPLGEVVDTVSWSFSTSGVALNRDPDGQPGAPLVNHDEVEGAAGPTSPGLRADGSAW